MDDTEKYSLYLHWWFEFQLPEFIPRSYPQGLLRTRAIPVFTGPRRSGKSTMLFQLIAELRQSEPAQNILYINFEDDRLAPLTGSELSDFLAVYRQQFPVAEDRPVYMLIDEIQNLPGWEKTIRRMYDTEPEVKLLITGSNSKLLSRNIATALRGRTLSIPVFPLNFAEFLMFKQIPLPERSALPFSDRQKNRLLRAFQEYFTFGGFPEVVLEPQELFKEKLLREYFHTIFFADIIERHEIRSVKLMDAFIKMLTRQMACLFSMGKMQASLQSMGFKVSKTTLIDYFGYIEEAFLGTAVPIYSYSIKDRLQYPRKFYLIDNGLFQIASFQKREDQGRLLENLVFWHLQSRYEDIYYWKGGNGFEVDFVLPELLEQDDLPALIQVCFDMTDDRTRKRERRALMKAASELGAKRALIITRDRWGEETLDNVQVTIRPFIDWALQERPDFR
ncbi:MAG: ATP-binding protein [candidate division KSB1 bacterium]|nr:ATP-binding protein [candidate division KSB1 bacterium]